MNAIIKLPNNFNIGNCENCPFLVGAYQDEIGGYGYYTYCLFEYEPEPDKVWNLTECDTCKLEIEESEEAGRMRECVYCGKKIDGNGIYFCSICKKKIKELGYVNTENVMSDWTAQAYWYLEENGGNYWKDYRDFINSPKEERELMGKFNFIRPIDYIRFDAYRKYLGKDVMEFPMNADNLNNMEKWYLELAKKESGE